jgi:hypothetical protein
LTQACEESSPIQDLFEWSWSGMRVTAAV